MAYKSIYDDIIFIESDYKEAKIIKNIHYNYGSFGSQNKNLNCVKKMLAYKAKKHKANCIINFKYGQKSSWISFDDNKWYGKGTAVLLDSKEFEKVKSDIMRMENN